MTNLQKPTEIDQLIIAAEKEIHELDAKKKNILNRIKELQQQKILLSQPKQTSIFSAANLGVNNHSSPEDKIALFRSLFKGREDVYPKRFENMRTGKSGYQPACKNEWVRGLCGKPKVKCSNCSNREFLPVSKDAIKNHLMGNDPDGKSEKDFTIGIYPLLPDETCWFLAVDFDKKEWHKDVLAFIETCQDYHVPAALERSRSGNGGHVWIFFSESVPAVMARKMGSFLLTETMEKRPEIGLDSYDRFFPNQDTMPQGGLGNLIALPLQKKPREQGNSVFLDEKLIPYPDQWNYLASIIRLTPNEVETIVTEASRKGRIMGVRMVITDDEDKPWLLPASQKRAEPPITGALPQDIELVLGNQIYISKEGLPPGLINRIIRIAAFQNPEFYKAQAMRLPTFDKPRIISCSEDFIKHIGLPRGCLDELLDLLDSLKIKVTTKDERFYGNNIDVHFHGILAPDQQSAVNALLKNDIGVFSASTAFGKTVIAIYAIAQRKTNTLILVHTRQLLDQWIARLTTFLGLEAKSIGQIGGGKSSITKFIDVALIQSLNRKGIVKDVVGEYGHLVIDECHHISAYSFEQVARQSKARYILGLSATVTRKDGHHPIIFMQCGPLRYQVDDRKQAAARPFDHKVLVRQTEFELPPEIVNMERPPIHEIYKALTSDEKRNNQIIKDVLESLCMHRSPVILTERKEHAAVLTELLKTHVTNVFVFKGGMGQKQRKMLTEQLNSVPEDKPRIIIATGRYLGEGFDDARLDTLFLTLPVSWKGIVAQYAGRLHRLHHAKKEVIIYDYADTKVSILAKMLERRKRGYILIGYKINENNPPPAIRNIE